MIIQQEAITRLYYVEFIKKEDKENNKWHENQSKKMGTKPFLYLFLKKYCSQVFKTKTMKHFTKNVEFDDS